MSIHTASSGIMSLLPPPPHMSLMGSDRPRSLRELASRCSSALRAAVGSTYFDYAVCVALVLNSIMIGVEAAASSRHVGCRSDLDVSAERLSEGATEEWLPRRGGGNTCWTQPVG